MLNSYLLKYLIVGVFNTFFGFAIIFYCMYLGVVAELSNFIGYFFGILISFFLNKKFTFKSNANLKNEFFKFVGSMYIAYIINLIILIIVIRFFNYNEYFGQILAGISYTIVGFLLSKQWVFKNKSNDQIL